MGVGGDLYRVILVAHILGAIAGFGAVMFGGVYAAQGRVRGAREALVIAEANYVVESTWAKWCIVSTFVLGIVLVLGSHGAWSFSQPWVAVSVGLFVVAMALAQGVMAPTQRKIRSLLGEMSAGAGVGCGNCKGGCGKSADTDAPGSLVDASASGATTAFALDGARATAIATATRSHTETEAPKGDPESMRAKAAQLASLGRRAGVVGGMLHLSIAAMLYLMVFKPGV